MEGKSNYTIARDGFDPNQKLLRQIGAASLPDG
jgi:hypothetical protein